jgi:hypothetical protein
VPTFSPVRAGASLRTDYGNWVDIELVERRRELMLMLEAYQPCA